jgi:hypothetical protein
MDIYAHKKYIYIYTCIYAHIHIHIPYLYGDVASVMTLASETSSFAIETVLGTTYDDDDDVYFI